MTVEEHINSMPEPYRSQALKNFDPFWFGLTFSEEANSLSDVLEDVFEWSKTPEGYLYWKSYHEYINR